MIDSLRIFSFPYFTRQMRKLLRKVQFIRSNFLIHIIGWKDAP